MPLAQSNRLARRLTTEFSLEELLGWSLTELIDTYIIDGYVYI